METWLACKMLHLIPNQNKTHQSPHFLCILRTKYVFNDRSRRNKVGVFPTLCICLKQCVSSFLMSVKWDSSETGTFGIEEQHLQGQVAKRSKKGKWKTFKAAIIFLVAMLKVQINMFYVKQIQVSIKTRINLFLLLYDREGYKMLFRYCAVPVQIWLHFMSQICNFSCFPGNQCKCTPSLNCSAPPAADVRHKTNSAPNLSKELDAPFDHPLPWSHKDHSFGDQRAVLI